MKEKDFQIKFGHWVKAFWKESGVFELKLAKGFLMPFDAVADHQIAALLATKKDSLFFKLPDCGYQNPFDCMFLKEISAYVVVMFYKPGQKEFIMIDAEVFLLEKQRSQRKSLLESRAKEIGFVYSL